MMNWEWRNWWGIQVSSHGCKETQTPCVLDECEQEDASFALASTHLNVRGLRFPAAMGQQTIVIWSGRTTGDLNHFLMFQINTALRYVFTYWLNTSKGRINSHKIKLKIGFKIELEFQLEIELKNELKIATAKFWRPSLQAVSKKFDILQSFSHLKWVVNDTRSLESIHWLHIKFDLRFKLKHNLKFNLT